MSYVVVNVFRGLARCVGRRGASLLFVGMLSFVLSTSLAFAPPELRAAPAFQALDEVAPLAVWAALWAVSGIVCFVQAFMRVDRITFALASATWWAYGLAYFVGVFSGVNPRGWVTGGIWIVFGAYIAFVISTWPEVVDLRIPPGESGDAIITADAGGVVRAFNAPAEALFGWEAASIVGRPVTVLMPERFHPAHRAGVARVRESGQLKLSGRVLELTGRHADGTEFPIELTLTELSTPAGVTYSGLVRRGAE
ncbi:PAS domain S-box protein [Microtetraspora sp. NBRC 13810]|uniref:PAS domain S-box protein n=1 Tax=Microtetraspora sp. NBRC 13810 TaxID=3030990 RepID=UPI002555ECF7|nr:PAS domain S-box protein [Microtetraspora sp. NBRC 13810]